MENKEELSQKKRRATKKVPKHEKLHFNARALQKDTQKYRNTEYSLFSEGITRRRKIMYNIFTIYIIYILYI